MLRVHDLYKSFGKTEVLRGLSFEVNQGEKVLVSAPSGGGKTTLLRILCSLEKADKGVVEGVRPEEISYCFQEPRLFPQLTALQNVTCILADPKSGEARGLELLEQMDLRDAADKFPHQLSGGMKQRVALARALIADRPVLLLDEPFTALDEERRDALRQRVKEFCQNKTLILVSHDPKDGEVLTERTIFL